MLIYKNLDDALTVVAKASFYEDKCVTPVPGGFTVKDTVSHATDEWYWTYEDGVKDRDSVSESSRLHASYESYDSASHIRYNMSESVELLEAGTHSVDFAYAVVNDEFVSYDDDGNAIDNDGNLTDDLAGWIMVANHYLVD